MDIKVYDQIHMDIAISMSKYSKANRAKVGAVLVTSNGVVLPSYNGTPSGMQNDCEENGVTKLTVIHAETNQVLKAAREGVSIHGCTIFVTLSPCMSCAAMLIQAGVRRVVYLDEYRDMSSVEYLRSAGVLVERFC